MQKIFAKGVLHLGHPIHILGMLYTLALTAWLANSQYYGDMTLVEFLLPAACLMLVTYAGWWAFKIRNIAITLPHIIIWAIIFRFIGLGVYPILEDDAFRYMWDGYQTLKNGSPYAYSPSYFFSDENISDTFSEILDHINYPDVPTIYWPTTQYVFALAAWIAPGEVWPLQLLMMCFDLIVLYVLCQFAKPLYVWLYAWSPLVIKETVITAHPDIIGIAFIWLAFLFQRKNMYIAATCCALAVSSKIFAVLIVPFCLLFHVRAWLLFAVILIAVFLPFLADYINLIKSLTAMGQGWIFNSPFYLVGLYVFPLASLAMLKAVLLALFAVFGLIMFYCYVANKSNTKSNGIVRGDIIFMVFLLVSPVANAWYFLWILPFAVIYPSLWAWVASCAVFLSYCIGLNLNDDSLNNYQIPGYIVAIEYGAIALALLASRYKLLKL